MHSTGYPGHGSVPLRFWGGWGGGGEGGRGEGRYENGNTTTTMFI